MPRKPRTTPGDYIYHTLNRATARLTLFRKADDYDAFERVLQQAHERQPTRILAYCLMPTHWHFVLWPTAEGEITAFLRWLTHTHTMRWHAHYHSQGSGHLYQGRFKSFPVAADEHLLTLLRYVEGNPRRAGKVKRAKDWRWSSLSHRLAGDALSAKVLHPWPLPEPENWLEWVEQPQTEAELKALRRSVCRGTLFVVPAWQVQVRKELGLEATLRARGRSKKK